MAAQTFFGNRVAIYLSDTSSVASGDLVLVAQDFTASAEFSNEDLYGTGSIVRPHGRGLRADRRKGGLRVSRV